MTDIKPADRQRLLNELQNFVPANNANAIEINVERILLNVDYFKGMFRYNEVSGAVDVVRHCLYGNSKVPHSVSDAEISMIQTIFQEVGIKGLSTNQIGRVIASVAARQPYDPIKDWIDSLPAWDGVDRLGNLRARWFPHCDGYDADGNEVVDKELERRINAGLRVWFMQAVERWRYPGKPAELVIIFVGKTGINKSRFGQALVPFPEWFTSNLPENLKNKDAMMLAGQTPLIEMGEMGQLKSNHVETIWNYLSIISDTFRPPYGKNNITIIRRCVFFGGSNEMEILLSWTGNRRLFPFEVDRINFKAVTEERDQVLAQALHELRRCYETGEEWRVVDALYEDLEKAKGDFIQSDPIDDYIQQFLEEGFKGKKVKDFWFPMSRLTDYIALGEKGSSRIGLERELAKRLRVLGYDSKIKVVVSSGQHRRLWHKKDDKGCLPFGNVDDENLCDDPIIKVGGSI